MKFFISILVFLFIFLNTTALLAKKPKSRFYDFNDQIIDGEIKRPTTLYTDSRERVRFDRLMKLKKSFLPELFKTSKERVFK